MEHCRNLINTEVYCISDYFHYIFLNYVYSMLSRRHCGCELYLSTSVSAPIVIYLSIYLSTSISISISLYAAICLYLCLSPSYPLPLPHSHARTWPVTLDGRRGGGSSSRMAQACRKAVLMFKLRPPEKLDHALCMAHRLTASTNVASKMAPHNSTVFYY